MYGARPCLAKIKTLVVRIVEEIAEKYHIQMTLLCDTNYVLSSDYSEVIVVGVGADAVDYKLISLCHKGDIVVSQDYGVVARAIQTLQRDDAKKILCACSKML